MRTVALAEANTDLQAEIARREQVEDALRESEKKYRKIVENAPTGIYEIDLIDFRFTEVNEVMCDILGYSREELLNINPQTLMTAETRLLANDRMAKLLAGEEISTTFEYKITAKDGRELWALLNAKAFYEDGKPARALTFAQDMTEIKQLEASLEAARFDLENTVVRAPADGMVPRLFLKPGMVVSPQRSVLTFVDSSELLIGAQFKQKALIKGKEGIASFGLVTATGTTGGLMDGTAEGGILIKSKYKGAHN